MENLASPVSYHTGPNAILLPIFAALSIAIVYVPFVLLLRVKKVAACTMVIVVAVVNFLTFINAILWPNDNIAAWFTGVGVCDIEVQIRTPMSTLLATSMAYLTKDLAMAMDTDNPRLVESRAQRRRRLWVELTFCFAIPILQMALYYIVQANRFAIVTVYGCVDSVDSSWPTVVIRAIWPPLFALLNCYYAILVIYRLYKHRGMLSKTLSSTGSGLSAQRFLKLFFMASSFLLIYLPVTLYFFYLNLPIPFTPYSWSRLHAPESWDPIVFYTTATFPRTQYNGWVGVAMGFLCFIFYGMNNEAIDIYKSWSIKLGFATLFPRLLQPREIERRGSSSSGTAKASWTHHFDLVSKTLHYLDGSRKSSQTSSISTISNSTQSMKVFDHAPAPPPCSHLPFSRSLFRTHIALPTPLFPSPPSNPGLQTCIWSHDEGRAVEDSKGVRIERELVRKEEVLDTTTAGDGV